MLSFDRLRTVISELACASRSLSHNTIMVYVIKTTNVQGTITMGNLWGTRVSQEAKKVKYAASTFMLMILMVLVGTAVWAACPGTCPAPVQTQIQCPVVVTQPVEVCPGPCPQAVQACPGTCPEPVKCPQTCCDVSIPAAVGAGPQGELMGIPCPDFDLAYAKSDFQQNATIIAVTELGMQRATNRNLRDISREIHGQLVSANEKLTPAYSGCATFCADPAQAQAIADQLCASGECFDVAYARTLSALLKQSQATSELAMTRSANAQIQQQAQFMAARQADWSFRLDRWVTDHGY